MTASTSTSTGNAAQYMNTKNRNVSDVASQVSHESDDEKTNKRTLSVIENSPYHRSSPPEGMISAYDAHARLWNAQYSPPKYTASAGPHASRRANNGSDDE